MNIVLEFCFEFGRWSKSERNQTIASMSFNKTLKPVPELGGGTRERIAGQRKINVVLKNSWRLKYSLIFITLVMSQPSKKTRCCQLNFSLQGQKRFFSYSSSLFLVLDNFIIYTLIFLFLELAIANSY